MVAMADMVETFKSPKEVTYGRPACTFGSVLQPTLAALFCHGKESNRDRQVVNLNGR